MIRKLYHYLLTDTALGKAQWFYKSEPSAFTKLDAEGPACPACSKLATHQSDYPSRVAPFSKQTVLYCAACGLGFVPGMHAILDDYYTDDYADRNRGDRDVAPEEYFRDHVAGDDPALEKYTLRSLRQAKLLRKFDAIFDTVLDYGSGPGYFLFHCKARVAHAVEPDVQSHKYLSYLGAQIHTDHTSLPENTFDCILASHAIEHLPPETLEQVLKTLIDALGPEGRLLIEVPQGGHSYLHLAGQRQDPHTLFFTGRALALSVRRAGGNILFQRSVGKVASPLREDPIYTPKGTPFFRSARGSLTIICTRRGAK